MRTWSKRPAGYALIFGLLIAGLAVYTVYGQETGRQSGQTSRQPGMTGQQGQMAQPGMSGQAMQYSPKLVNANKLIGKEVRDSKGQKIGSVEDVVLDSSRQRVGFVVLSTGGTMGIGQKYFAVPWHALTIPTADEPVTFNATKEQIQGAPKFEKGKWPSAGDPMWRQSMQYWHQQMGMMGGMERGQMRGRDYQGKDPAAGGAGGGVSGGTGGGTSGGAMGGGGTTGDQTGMGAGTPTTGPSGPMSGGGMGGTTGDANMTSGGMTEKDQAGSSDRMTHGRQMGTEEQYSMDRGAAQSPMKYRRLTQIIGQNVKDTLCGTKVLSRADYDTIAANRAYFGDWLD